MFGELINLANELRARLQDAVYDAVNPRLVQGAQLEIDNYWMRCWWIENYGLPVPWHIPGWQSHLDPYRPIPLDFGFRPKGFSTHCYKMGLPEGAGPVRIRVILRSPTHGETATPERIGFNRFQDFPVVYEIRPATVATGLLGWLFPQSHTGGRSRRGLSVGRAVPPSAGTLGGRLQDPVTKQVYLVSCAHVFGPAAPNGVMAFSPGPFESASPSPIGVVRYSRVASLKPSDEPCSHRRQPDAETVDLSVVEWVPLGASSEPPFAPTPKAYRLCDAMSQGHPVTFTGKESGTVRAELSAVTVWKEIEFEDFGDGPKGVRCFGTLFEMTDGDGDVTELAQPGDSGAWVFDDGGQGAWIGMLLARQGKRAYGCFSEFIFDAIQTSKVFPNGLAAVI